MLVEYGGWSQTTGKKREAISSGESFEQANFSDMNRHMQRLKTKSAFRSDLNLRTASPVPSSSMWSGSDNSDGGAMPVQVVVNKSAAELAVERQKAHGGMVMANIAMKKQAFDAAKEMHQLFPADDTWREALHDAAREYMAACKTDVLVEPPAGWASESKPHSRPPKRLSEVDGNLQDFQTPEPQSARRRQIDEDEENMFLHQDGEPSVTYEVNTESQPLLLHGCDVCRLTHTELQALAAANPERPETLFALSMCLSNPTNVHSESDTCTRLVCGSCEKEPHPWWHDEDPRGRWCKTHCNQFYAVVDGDIIRGTNPGQTEPDPRLVEPRAKRGRRSKQLEADLSSAVPTQVVSKCVYKNQGFQCLPTELKCVAKPSCASYVCDACSARLNPENENLGHYCPEHAAQCPYKLRTDV